MAGNLFSGVRKLAEASEAELARRNGYTHYLVDEDGAPIGTVTRSPFWPGTWFPGDSYEYAREGYAVVEVRDDYPDATERIVLRPDPTGEGRYIGIGSSRARAHS